MTTKVVSFWMCCFQNQICIARFYDFYRELSITSGIWEPQHVEQAYDIYYAELKVKMISKV